MTKRCTSKQTAAARFVRCAWTDNRASNVFVRNICIHRGAEEKYFSRLESFFSLPDNMFTQTTRAHTHTHTYKGWFYFVGFLSCTPLCDIVTSKRWVNNPQEERFYNDIKKILKIFKRVWKSIKYQHNFKKGRSVETNLLCFYNTFIIIKFMEFGK